MQSTRWDALDWSATNSFIYLARQRLDLVLHKNSHCLRFTLTRTKIGRRFVDIAQLTMSKRATSGTYLELCNGAVRAFLRGI